MSGSLPPDEVILVHDKHLRGACWARNRGAEYAHGEFVLFSDDDLEWEKDGLENLYRTLEGNPTAAYSYGWYLLGQHIVGRQNFSLDLLHKHNFITTMALIRRDLFPGFDEQIHRYQDWDLWLTMAEQGKYGAYTDTLIFRTRVDMGGITGRTSKELGDAIIRKKHGLPGPKTKVAPVGVRSRRSTAASVKRFL